MAGQSTQPDPVNVVIDDLLSRIANISLDAAQWRARAIIAEAALAELTPNDEDGKNDETTDEVEQDVIPE